ncbi:MAG TPA: methyltransferase domain-containing protein, partial [Ktedonobacterales bacterium]
MAVQVSPPTTDTKDTTQLHATATTPTAIPSSANLVAFSLRTKGAGNFARRLWTVFTRFGVSDGRTRRDLHAIVEAVADYGGTPTFFIPAVVLGRHSALIVEIAGRGAEIGIHGYVHNDYRSLDANQQLEQTERAAAVFRDAGIAYEGFRNPYLGWNEDSLDVFAQLGLAYDSNEAVIHDVVDPAALSASLRDGYEKSLELFQAIPYRATNLRPHYEGALLRIPTSIPDDEMLYDRLRVTNNGELGGIWSRILRRVYDVGGVYVLNLHPERGLRCRPALERLLAAARSQPRPVWLASLREIAAWWAERCGFTLVFTPLDAGRWQVKATCSERATILARHVAIEDAETREWAGPDRLVPARRFVVQAERCPCVALSPRTTDDVAAYLREQGYPAARAPEGDAERYALYLDLPEGLGATLAERGERRAALVDQIEALDAPLVRFGCWPDGARAALSITGDIDSVTVQDFFLRIAEARLHSARTLAAGPSAPLAPEAMPDARPDTVPNEPGGQPAMTDSQPEPAADGARRDHTREAGMYAYAIKLGMRELVRGKFNWALRHLLLPVPYWRSLEFRLVRGAAAFTSRDRILDIGSPKLLAIYLAKALGADVYATDIEDYFVREYTTLRDLEHLSPERFHVQVEDGRALSFADNSFDKVFSISVMEHIPDNGDAACAREMARVLAPGGRCLITVPFSPTSRTIYRKAKQFYWAGSSVEQEGSQDANQGEGQGEGMAFFQRRYSEQDLRERIIGPSGLRLRALRFVGERVWQNSPKEV